MFKGKSIRTIAAAAVTIASITVCCAVYTSFTPETTRQNSIVYASETSEDYEFSKKADADGNDYYAITKYTGSDVKLIIPTEFTVDETTLPVKVISGSAFKGNKTLESVVIPEGITEIGSEAFSGCTSLADVSFPTTLTVLADSAFSNCPIKDLIINGDFTSYSTAAFNTDAVESITFGGKATVIPAKMCKGMKNLKAVTISDSVTEISASAFENCTSLTAIEIPDSVKKIGDYAFYGCTALASADIGNGVETIGERAFYAYPGGIPLTDLTLGSSLREIGNEAFTYATIQGALELPDSLEVIGQSAFGWCNEITEVEFGKSTKTIGKSAFQGCNKLTEIYLNEGLTEIGESAFENVDLLGRVTIPNGVKTIGAYAFYNCMIPQITAVTLPDTLEEIGAYAFRGNPITKIVIPDSVTTIGGGAFYECRNLKSVKLSKKLERIPASCFELTGIESLVIPDSVKSIGASAFTNCGSLKELTFGNGLETIEDEAFEFANITCLRFPDSLKDIGNNAFYNNEGLEQIQNWPSSLETLGESVFCECGSLREIPVIPAQIGEIPAQLFSGCSNLTRVDIEDGITSIGDSAFSECGLTEIVIPDSVLTIKANAFSYNNLQDITIGNGVTKIASRAFVNNPVKNVYVPDSVTSLGAQCIGIWVDGYDSAPTENFTLYGNTQIVKDYVSDNELNFVAADSKAAIPGKTEYIDKATGIHVFTESSLTLKVVKLNSADEITAYASMDDGWETVGISATESVLCGYDILLYKNGELYVPDEDIKVMMPVPEEYKDALFFGVYGSIYVDRFGACHYTNDGAFAENGYITCYDTVDNSSQNVIVLKAELPVEGDANLDGKFSAADVVSLQRYLLCCGDLPNREAADLCQDNKINVFDLCIMKRMLLEQN